ncbi:hypothetical protein SAMN02799624_00536 [Paenibacillus sp. UNC496MF]|uniref:hypothetical protein n=1 Tax=Paenibacillus sp. UNC496MF TaxID=1502753 RepID=UPI0008E4EB81|nr:hypothetical protein [Paenibacillus sp. UNC496MF]SFI35326.1 hypothetical protein SAMN02799624_00536 [Paenibacillus sp. UNC496MF]
MNTVQGIVRMHLRDKWSWIYMPWVIVLSSFAVNLLIAGLMADDDRIVTGGLMSIFVYMLVSGIVAVHHTFPFALGLSVRRRDYFSGTLIMILSVSVASSLILLLLSYIESWTDGWNADLFFFHLPYVSDGNALQQFIVFGSLMLFMYLLGFAISSLFRRFGKTGLYSASIIGLLLGTLFVYGLIYWGWWNGIRDFFDGRSAFNVALLLLPASALLALAGYAFLRRSTV